MVQGSVECCLARMAGLGLPVQGVWDGLGGLSDTCVCVCVCLGGPFQRCLELYNVGARIIRIGFWSGCGHASEANEASDALWPCASIECLA